MKCCCCYSCTANISIECYRIYTSVTTVFQYWCKLETSQIFQVQNAMPTDLHCLQSMNYWLLQFTMSISEFLNIAIWTARNWLQYCYIVMNSPKTNKFACGYVEYMMKILSVISNIITNFMHFLAGMCNLWTVLKWRPFSFFIDHKLNWLRLSTVGKMRAEKACRSSVLKKREHVLHATLMYDESSSTIACFVKA